MICVLTVPSQITFGGPEDPSNPKNWPLRKKWLVVTTVSLYAFLSPMTSTMIAPALPELRIEFNIQNQTGSALMLSIFLLGWVIGPIITSPLSEVYGRVIVLQLGTLIYLVFNLASGFAQTQAQTTVLRLFAGIGGSTSLGIEGGIIADCFAPEQRGLAVSIYNLMPLLGPAVGPIIGAFITEYFMWRWSFWATSIADVVIQLAGLVFLDESWAPNILERKKTRLMKQTGNKNLYTLQDVHDEGKTLASRLRLALTRPLKLLFTQVIVQARCLYLAYLFGVTFLVLSTLSSLWTERYGFSIGIGSLNYIALGIGYTFGTQVSARLNDKIYKHLKSKNDGRAVPEYRLPMMTLGATLMPIGLLIYAWTSQYRVHWIVVDIGVAIYAAGTFASFQCLQTYLIDTYTTYTASAFAAATILRSIFGTVFPLFANQLYETLDYGWGTTTLALIAIVTGWPAPILLWKFGPQLRARSPYSAEKT